MPIAAWWWEYEFQNAKAEAEEKAMAGGAPTKKERAEAMSIARKLHEAKRT
ncbi:hypothetical protein [Dinoroseobacter sp. S124A]|uniref:hypothetical protein n=1 Tax=Dinoroseobacter sp. S124A TaxID=3415128 RepID=UPI003C797444